MPIAVNEKLKKLADESSLKYSAIPLFICDESLAVCTKSIGAERSFRIPTVRSSVASYLPMGEIKEVMDGTSNYVSTTFSRGRTSSYCLFTSGMAENIRYYVLLVEPMVRFCPKTEPWYIKESIKNLSSALSINISSEKPKHGDLVVMHSRLCQLFSFIDSSLLTGPAFSDLCGIIELIGPASKPILAPLHAELTLTELPKGNINVTLPPTAVYIMTATMIAVSVMLSSDGKVDLSCYFSNTEGTTSITVSTNACELAEICYSSSRNLITSNNPLALELAALHDMCETNKTNLESSIINGILSFTLHIEAAKYNSEIFTSSEIQSTNIDFFHSFLSNILTVSQLYK